MKNIIIFSDGTGQDGGSERNTNVYQMFNMMEQRTPRQVCYYDPGVGSTGTLARVPGLASGSGFGQNVRDCYGFLFENYQAGDRLYFIGFSRGAATVRSLAAFVHLFGILPRSRRALIDRAWKIYTIRDRDKRKAAAEEFVGFHHTMRPRVHFLGCFDTVAALGLPYNWASRALDRVPGMKHRFYDFRLTANVVHAYHALALDDRRTTFHPVLWDPLEDEPAGSAGVPEDERLSCETLKQVWFAGVHADIGGGYVERGLSDIPLVWMTRAAIGHGVRIYPKHRVTIYEDPDGPMHDPTRGVPGRFYRRSARAWDPERPDTPVIHESALLRHGSDEDEDDPPYEAWLAHGEYVMEPWRRITAGDPLVPVAGDALVEPAASGGARPSA